MSDEDGLMYPVPADCTSVSRAAEDIEKNQIVYIDENGFLCVYQPRAGFFERVRIFLQGK